MMLRKNAIALTMAVVLLLCHGAYGQSLEESYQALLREYESATEEWGKRFDLPEEAEVDWIARYRDWPAWVFAPRFLELGQYGRESTIAFQALSKVVEMGNSVDATDEQLYPSYSKALELLTANHLDKELRPLCVMVSRKVLPISERFLQILNEQGRERELRAEATFRLGCLFAHKHALIQRLSSSEQPEKSALNQYIARRCQKVTAESLKGADDTAAFDQAVRTLKLAIDEYSDVAGAKGQTIAEAATAELFELQHLSIGQVPPEIEGTDLDGEAMTLSQYRGKVVLLVFWASWCGPCMGDVPHEKELVERFQGRPFVIVGVNGDDEPEKATLAVRKNSIPWLSFQNGTKGPITSAWNVRSLPTVYLLDHSGVIRFKQLRRDSLDTPLERLIEAAEKAIPKQ